LPDQAKPLNVLWFTTDQQRFDTIASLGNGFVFTPNIDRLASDGVAFTHAFCQSPICTPSRSSFLTGLMPSTIRANRNGNARFSGVAPLVSKMFADAGYVCGNIGKLHLAAAADGPEHRVDDGYTTFEYSLAPREHGGYDYAAWVRAKGEDIGTLANRADGVPTHLHQPTWCAERACEFISRNSDARWFLTVNPFDPHPPFDPPREWREKFDWRAMPGPHFRDSDMAQQSALGRIDFQTRPRPPAEVSANADAPKVYTTGAALGLHEDVRRLQAAYYAMIALVDDQFGRILEHLARLGQDRDTLVIFTSDHGEMLGDHGRLLKGARFYEGLVRVPLIMRLPGRFEAGLRSDALVQLTDIVPTLLETASLPPPPRLEGKSLVPIASGGAPAHRHRDFVRAEYFDALKLPAGSSATMFRTRSHKLVVYHDEDLGELYDLTSDPWEFDNLWDRPDFQVLKADLILRSFNASVAALDKGPPRASRW
jgi:arylsulfatase A-like enzyme